MVWYVNHGQEGAVDHLLKKKKNAVCRISIHQVDGGC